MPWFRHPLTWSLIRPDPAGPFRVNLRAAVPSELERRPGDWVPVRRAVLDTGASLCVFSAVWARAVGLELPPASSGLPLRTATGEIVTRVYDFSLNVRFRGLPEQPFPLAVVFSESHPPNVPPLLGLHNLLNFWRFTFDGTPEPAAPLGHMRFEAL